MRHERFDKAAVGATFEVIEELVLPSLTLLIDRANGAEPGLNADSHAADLRALARQLESLTAMLSVGHETS